MEIEALLGGAFPAELSGEDPAVRLLHAHLSEGCSVCARSFVNSRDTSVDWLTAQVENETPAPALRGRILQTLSARPSRQPKGEKPRTRIWDPSGSTARLHMQGPGEAVRLKEVQDLGAGRPHMTEGGARILEEVQKQLDFPLLFISVIAGERVVAYAQRGLPEELSVLGSLEREYSFCTHCVNAERPLVVRDASQEPFFRGNPSVRKLNIRAYAGVPLRTSRGVVIGTLCALDWKARDVSPEMVAVLESYAREAASLIESEAVNPRPAAPG